MSQQNEALATCAKCGRYVPVSQTCEASLVATGALCEFFHCADTATCAQAREMRRVYMAASEPGNPPTRVIDLTDPPE